MGVFEVFCFHPNIPLIGLFSSSSILIILTVNFYSAISQLIKMSDTNPKLSTSSDVSELEKKRIFIVENYWFHHRSCDKVRTAWRGANLPRSEIPDNKDISRLIQKFENFGTVKNLNKGRSGRDSATTPELKEAVEDFFANNPSSSTRKASAVL